MAVGWWGVGELVMISIHRHLGKPGNCGQPQGRFPYLWEACGVNGTNWEGYCHYGNSVEENNLVRELWSCRRNRDIGGLRAASRDATLPLGAVDVVEQVEEKTTRKGYGVVYP
eukprot:Gb_23698 [translate_table: standard]